MSKQSRVIIFCGKGGVGKTTLSLALGLKQAIAGRRVVVVSSHPLRELAVAVSLAGLSEAFPVAAHNLFIVHLDPKTLLAEVVEQNFPVQWVARAILNNQIYQNLVEVAPGLKEFYFLARLQQLAERKKTATIDGVPNYDLLLWDAPATGHFLSTLRSASFETYLNGPLAAAGADLARFFSNAAHTTVLPTTTLEEMAVTETIEMSQALEKDFGLKPTAVILNQVSPLANASEEEMERVRKAGEASSDPALRFAVERGVLEREHAAAVRSAIPVPMVAVERIRRWSGDLDLLRHVGSALEAAPLAI